MVYGPYIVDTSDQCDVYVALSKIKIATCRERLITYLHHTSRFFASGASRRNIKLPISEDDYSHRYITRLRFLPHASAGVKSGCLN